MRWSPEEVVLFSPVQTLSLLYSFLISSTAGTYLMSGPWVHPLLWGFGCWGSGPWEQSWWSWGDLLQRNLGTYSNEGWPLAGGLLSCWPCYWDWPLVERTTGNGFALFGSSWKLITAYSIYKRRNPEAIPLKSSTCSSVYRHISLKSSCVRC